jgi:hypothetical protein
MPRAGGAVLRRQISQTYAQRLSEARKADTMARDRFYSSESQVFWTCKALLDNRTISHRTEIREVRGWRLGAIVHRLRHHYGWPIHAEYRGPQNVAHYFLKAGIDRSKLRFPPSARALAVQGVAE